MRNIIYLIIGIIFGTILCGTVQAHTANYHMTTKPVAEIEYIYIEKQPEIITEYVYVPQEPEFYRNFTDEDIYYLKDIAMREAEGEDVIGQCWVMYCVICRAEAYGKSIKEIVLSDAFKSSINRSGKTPNDNCNEALALIEEGWVPKPLWFRRDNYHNFGTPLCQVGKHYFSCK